MRFVLLLRLFAWFVGVCVLRWRCLDCRALLDWIPFVHCICRFCVSACCVHDDDDVGNVDDGD